MIRRALTASMLLAVTACGGGGSTPAAPAVVAPTPPVTAKQQLVATSFGLGLAPNAAASSVRAPRFIGAGGRSATVTLTGISGASIPAGLTTSVTSTIALPCPCTVAGPAVPPGIDSFAFTVYDGPNGTGNAIASTSTTFTVALGVANSFTTVLSGIPATASLTNLPPFVAGTPSSSTLGLTVKDADANAITGTFAFPVVITTNSPGGALGQQLSVNGGAAGTGVTVRSSADVVTFAYGGLATGPTTLLLYSGAAFTNVTIPIVPTVGPIGYSGPFNGSTPEVDLYAATGTGSSGTFTLSEPGFSNAPYSQAFLVTPSVTCASLATVTLTAPATYLVATVAAPVAGTCQIFVQDSAGQALTIPVTYTGNSVGVQSRRPRTPR
jgi:hypothetical protein